MKIKLIIKWLSKLKRKLFDPTQEEVIMNRLRELAEKYPVWGYHKLHVLLTREGYVIGKHKTRKLMKKLGVIMKKKKRAGSVKGQVSTYGNLTEGIKASSPNMIWFADFTYIFTKSDGVVYAAFIMDGYSRRIIGYAIGFRMDAHLVLRALLMAMSHRNYPRNVIHHSDRGSQYSSATYIQELVNNGFRISMSKKSYPYDNGAMERLMNTVKYEEVYLWEYDTIKDVRLRIKEFIHVYNEIRPHESLGYLTPNEFEALLRTIIFLVLSFLKE